MSVVAPNSHCPTSLNLGHGKPGLKSVITFNPRPPQTIHDSYALNLESLIPKPPNLPKQFFLPMDRRRTLLCTVAAGVAMLNLAALGKVQKGRWLCYLKIHGLGVEFSVEGK